MFTISTNAVFGSIDLHYCVAHVLWRGCPHTNSILLQEVNPRPPEPDSQLHSDIRSALITIDSVVCDRDGIRYCPNPYTAANIGISLLPLG